MPMTYSDEQRAEFKRRAIEYVQGGMSLRKACMEDDMPTPHAIRNWVVEDPEFGAQYTRAREARADARADKIDEICEDVEKGTLDPAQARMLFDAQRWQAGKEAPKRYADRNVHQGADDAPPVKIEATSAPMPANEKLELARWIAFSLQQGADAANTGSVDEQK